MARIAVTGGAGFIGSHLVERLARAGHALLVVDDLSSGSLANLDGVRGELRFEPLDVRRGDELARLLSDWAPDAIAHLAAVASVPRSIAEPVAVHDVNLNGTLAALEAARLAGARRFVFASSAAVYGGTPSLPSHESDPVDPASPYAAQKAAGELLLRAYRAAWGIETVPLRFFNVFGERQQAGSPYSGVISVFASQLRRCGSATIFGDGEQSRDFIYVADVARAVEAALTGPDSGSAPINVARGEAISIRDLYTLLARRLEAPDAPQFGPERPGDVRHSRADVERMHRLLGVRAEILLEDGLARLLDWEAARAV
jgi:UDP-glucose 4-epimerase